MKQVITKQFDFIFIFKTAAILLIINSHMKPIFPDFLDVLAFGGAFGCALFFFCSGYCLNIKQNETFGQYVFKRLIRIYPAMWILLLLTQSYSSLMDFLWYDRYWFLQAILVFYPIFYFIHKYLSKYMLHLIMLVYIALIVVYIYVPHSKWIIDSPKEPHHITWIYYFGIMLIASLLRESPPRFHIASINNLCRYIFLLISFITVYTIKFLCQKEYLAIDLQILFPFILTTACILVYIIFRDYIITKSSYRKFFVFMSSISLELYLVQFKCIYYSAEYAFPICIILVLILIPLSAILLSNIVRLCVDYIVKKIKF